ncbi:MAG: hypothetical protein JNL50_06520 [Phycisphaerae bacterium]|nr:hypothetical protein [Phycisphaerae bacterium]
MSQASASSSVTRHVILVLLLWAASQLYLVDWGTVGYAGPGVDRDRVPSIVFVNAQWYALLQTLSVGLLIVSVVFVLRPLGKHHAPQWVRRQRLIGTVIGGVATILNSLSGLPVRAIRDGSRLGYAMKALLPDPLLISCIGGAVTAGMVVALLMIATRAAKPPSQ